MPQLVKGGKWVFGWVVVGQQHEIQIPPAAYHEYGFQAGEPIVIIRGSQRSGGFGLGRQAIVIQSPIRSRILAEGRIGENMRLYLPQALEIQPGKRLLAVRGSGLALSFLLQGPIYKEALHHPEIEEFAP